MGDSSAGNRSSPPSRAYPPNFLKMNRIVGAIQKTLLFCSAVPLLFCSSAPVLALPPPEDTPEEILRTEVITEARSPIDGRPLTAAEYAELQAQLAEHQPTRPQVSAKVRELIFLLRVRRVIRRIIPFIDF